MGPYLRMCLRLWAFWGHRGKFTWCIWWSQWITYFLYLIIFVKSCGIAFFHSPSRWSSCDHLCLLLFLRFDDFLSTDDRSAGEQWLQDIFSFSSSWLSSTSLDVDALLEFCFIHPSRGVTEQCLNQISLLITVQSRQSYWPENVGGVIQ